VIYESLYCNASQHPISPKLSQCLSVIIHYTSIDIEGCMLQCWFEEVLFIILKLWRILYKLHV